MVIISGGYVMLGVGASGKNYKDTMYGRREEKQGRLMELQAALERVVLQSNDLVVKIEDAREKKTRLPFARATEKHPQLFARMDELLKTIEEYGPLFALVDKSRTPKIGMEVFHQSEHMLNHCMAVYQDEINLLMPNGPMPHSWIGRAGMREFQEMLDGKFGAMEPETSVKVEQTMQENSQQLLTYMEGQIARTKNLSSCKYMQDDADVKDKDALRDYHQEILPFRMAQQQCTDAELCSRLIERSWKNIKSPESLAKCREMKDSTDDRLTLAFVSLKLMARYYLYGKHHGGGVERLPQDEQDSWSELDADTLRKMLSDLSERLLLISAEYTYLTREFQSTKVYVDEQKRLGGELNVLLAKLGVKPGVKPKSESTLLRALADIDHLPKKGKGAPAKPILDKLSMILLESEHDFTNASKAPRDLLKKFVRHEQQSDIQQALSKFQRLASLLRTLSQSMRAQDNLLPTAAVPQSSDVATAVRPESSTVAKPKPMRLIQTECDGVVLGRSEGSDMLVESDPAEPTVYRRQSPSGDIWFRQAKKADVMIEPASPVGVKECSSRCAALLEASELKQQAAKSWEDFSIRHLASDHEQSATSVYGCLANHANGLTELGQKLATAMRDLPIASDGDVEVRTLRAQCKQKIKDLDTQARNLKQQGLDIMAGIIQRRPTWQALKYWMDSGFPIDVEAEVRDKPGKGKVSASGRHSRQNEIQPLAAEPDFLNVLLITLNRQAKADHRPACVRLHVHCKQPWLSEATIGKAHFKTEEPPQSRGAASTSQKTDDGVRRIDVTPKGVGTILAIMKKSPENS